MHTQCFLQYLQRFSDNGLEGTCPTEIYNYLEKVLNHHRSTTQIQAWALPAGIPKTRRI